MGPFPHTAPPASISALNPAGTDGFEFIEFAHPEPESLVRLFEQMGFELVARHRQRDVRLFRQGDINLLLSAESGSHAAQFARAHGPCASAMGFRVVDARHALQVALENGATEYTGPGKVLPVPAIEAIGGALIYFIDAASAGVSPYAAAFEWLGERDPRPQGVGFHYVDHLTHNVHRGNMDTWFDFYRDIFNFRQIRFFDIEGKHTGLTSRALVSPCGKIRIPINESADERSQIEEYLTAYRGEGIQHIAFGTHRLYDAADALAENGLDFMPPPPATYYEMVAKRLPGHREPMARMRRHGILVDGDGVDDVGNPRLLLQVFSQTVVGPIFFEFIQRKGDDGFGEGNFRALFESIEADQIRRGVLHGAG